MTAVKLTGARRFISPKCGVESVVERNDVIDVSEAQAAYLTSLTKKDKSNNVHPLFVTTDEDATASADAKMSEQQRLAKVVRAEYNDPDVTEEVPEIKTRRPKKDGTRGTRHASKIVA
jgi:hypothetical protein